MAQYYVAKTGSDSNPGTVGSPWLTIGHAVPIAAAGDTVNVGDGTYTESNLNFNKSGTAGNLITFKSTNQYGAKIVGNNGTFASAVTLSGDFVQINGFDVTGGNAVGIDAAGSNDEVRYNYVHDVPAIGVGGFGGALIDFSNFPTKSGGIADGNLCLRIGNIAVSAPPLVQGLYAAIPNVTFSNNIVCGVEAYAVNIGHYSINCIVVNNTMFGNGNDSLDSGGVVIAATDSGSPISDGHRVRNNIIYDNKGIGLHEEGAQGSNIIYSNNFVVGNNTNFGVMNGHSNTNNITSGIPGFVNYQRNGSGDYHLATGSVCKDAGISTNAPLIDFFKVIRPQGTLFDIGAAEFVTASAITNALQSTVIRDQPKVAASGFAKVTITVTLKDSGGAVISSGPTVVLNRSNTTTTIIPSSITANSSGVATFTATDTIIGVCTYTATDTTNTIIINQTASNNFTSPTEFYTGSF